MFPTANEPKVPTDVIFAWAAVVNVPPKLVAVTVIVFTDVLPLIFPLDVMLPVIVWVSEAALPKTVFPVEFTASNVSM
jgi:hypothetical protein